MPSTITPTARCVASPPLRLLRMIVLYDANGREIDQTLVSDRTGCATPPDQERPGGLARSL
jgi:hypothetical protein